MTRGDHTADHPAADRVPAADFVLPLVSIIIVNYNYGRFLEDAVASVFGQTYENIECLVVDNKSTDDSRTILEDLQRRFPQLQIVYRETNDGQCVATAEVFPRTKGHYVVFLDADDVLLPDFVGTHLFVHLSLTTHVGFTCSDMIQSVGHELVLGTSSTIEDRPAWTMVAANLLRPLASRWSAKGLVVVQDSELTLIPRDTKGWPWTATSAFVFRRDALAIFMDNPRLQSLHCALDVYFGRGINALTGSVVIDRALSIYRMHGANIFSRHPHLNRCANFDPRQSTNNQNVVARQEIIQFWFARARFMIQKLLIRNDYIDGIVALNEAYPRLTDSSGSRRSYAAARFLDHAAELRAIVGLPTLLRWAIRLRLSPFAVLKAVKRPS